MFQPKQGQPLTRRTRHFPAIPEEGALPPPPFQHQAHPAEEDHHPHQEDEAYRRARNYIRQLEQEREQERRLREQQQRELEQQQEQEEERHRRARSPAYNGAYISNILSGLTAVTPKRKIMQNIHSEMQSSGWLATEMLKRTDLSSGDICMFHYPMDFFPSMDVEEMGRAFEIIISGGGQLEQAEEEQPGQEVAPPLRRGPIHSSPRIPPVYLPNATPDARSRITRIQFSWYQFEEFPRGLLGQSYANLQHLDIRQNASLRCIDSLISQLPQLTSLNLSDCPNIRTLLPLATALEMPHDEGIDDGMDPEEESPRRRTSNLRHLWVRGCNLSSMPREEWATVFDALAESSGPLERLTLSRNSMEYLHENIGKLQRLTYLFVEDNYSAGEGVGGTMKNDTRNGFQIPQELGNLPSLRFISLCGNNVTSLPRTMGRLNDNCDFYLHRNSNLVYPPAAYQKSIKSMRLFFHEERMKLFRGAVLFMPHIKRARWRANERLYRPGGWGYTVCKERFEETVRRTSLTMME